MTKQGWVALHRQLQEHWLWADKPFSRGQAWVDLLLLANHKNNKFLLGNELVEVKKGSFITSELKLMERWGWGKEKTRTFLKLLQSDGMIIKLSDRKKTTITIVNYSDYAVFETASRPQTDRKQTTSRPRADTNNNDNNENNDNNIFFVDDAELNAAIVSFVEHRKDIKKPMTEHAIKLMISKLNKMTPDISERIEILNQSIVNGWQGIFPLKKAEKKKKTAASIEAEAAKERIAAVERHMLEKWAGKAENPPKTAADDENIRARAEALKQQFANG